MKLKSTAPLPRRQMPRRRMTLVCKTGFAFSLMAASTLPLPGPVHIGILSQARAASAGETEIGSAYKSSLAADKHFSDKKWSEAVAVYESSIQAMKKAFRRDDNLAYFEIKINPHDLAMTRRIPEQLLTADFSSLRENRISASNYIGLMEKMRDQAQQIIGPKDWWTDERIIEYAYADSRDIELPVPDRDWDPVMVRLDLAQDKIEAVLARREAWRNAQFAGRWQGLTGQNALDEVKAKLAEAKPEWERSRNSLAQQMPDNAKIIFDREMVKLSDMRAGVERSGYMETSMAEYVLVKKQTYFQRTADVIRAEYTREARTMPETLMNPIKESWGKLDAAINKNAPRFSFPANGTRDAVIEAKVSKQMTARGAKVIRTGMDRNSWQIVKNNVGFPLRRNKTGWVLYKLPGEKWARLSTFFYNESYAGGGRYSPSAGASHFPTFRWQKGS